MKPMHLFILVATTTAFLMTFFISTGLPTGFLVSDELKLEVEEVKAYETEAVVTWSTNKEALSTIVIDGKRTAFPSGSKFSKAVTGLEAGTKYEFVIRACDASGCKEEKRAVATERFFSQPSPITGAVTGGEGIVELARQSANLVIYALLGLIAAVVAGRVGMQAWQSRNQLPGLISKAENHLENDKYREAYEAYSQARQAFTQLEEEAKLKHYEKLLGIYQSLKRYSAVKEAQLLTEKYENGTITREEMRRLSELLAS